MTSPPLGPGDSPFCSKNMETSMAAVCTEACRLASRTVVYRTSILYRTRMIHTIRVYAYRWPSDDDNLPIGMELDSLEGVIRLPKDKLWVTIEYQLQKWCAKMACRKRELLSLLHGSP